MDADGGAMSITRYGAAIDLKRPCVLLLHGARGVELSPRAYERYAYALTAEGIDTYLLRYFTAADTQALDPKTSTRSGRENYETGRFKGWAERISSILGTILARPDSSGRLGLLGFSLGGYVAAATAALDDRVSALAVLYGGMPDEMVPQVKHLPALIELHGEADTNVPLDKGRQLVKLAGTLGAKAELVTYPGKGHGFDFKDGDVDTADAIRRVGMFFRSRLVEP